MLHARRAASAYQLAVRPGSDGEFMGACCSLIRIVGDEEPGLFAGLTGGRAYLDKALRRIDQNPEGAAVVAVRLAQTDPGVLHYLMGSTSNKKLDDVLKVARGVWLCGTVNALTDAAGEGTPLEAWAKRKASTIRDLVRAVGWAMPADGARIGATAGEEPRSEAGANDSPQVAYARSVGRALNAAMDPSVMFASTRPAMIAKDGSVVQKKMELKPQFASQSRQWLYDRIQGNAEHAISTSQKYRATVVVEIAGLSVTITARVFEKAGQSATGANDPQALLAKSMAIRLDHFIKVARPNAKDVTPAEISGGNMVVFKAYTVAQPNREVKTVSEKLARHPYFARGVLARDVYVSGGVVIIKLSLARV
jgi:hypothetical protein